MIKVNPCLLLVLMSLGFSQINVPTQSMLLNTLQTAHPRLLIDTNGFTQLRLRMATDTMLQRWYRSVKSSADQILTQPVSVFVLPDGLRLLATSRAVWDRIHKLALAYRIEGTTNYRDRAWAELSAAAAFPSWNPQHFLDVAEMTHAFAIGYDWFYDAWTPAQRTTIRTAIENFGLRPALLEYQNRTFWVSAKHNWNQVCNGGIGLGALAIADESPTLAPDLLYRALTSLRDSRVMDEYAPDGGWIEGPGYWDYGTRYNVLFLSGLQTALGSSFGFESVAGFSESGTFPIYVNGPFDRAFNFSDVGGTFGVIREPSMFWLARTYRRAEYSWHGIRYASPMPLDLLWYDASGIGFTPQSMPLDRYFRHIEVATLRSAWNDRNALFSGLEGGNNAANHSQLEMGNFMFDALGYRWAGDLGSDDYNLPGYFSTASQRWTYYRLRAEGNNTLVLNPGTGPEQSLTGKGQILYYGSVAQEVKAVADLTSAYVSRASRYWRGLALVSGRKALLVQDEVISGTASEAWWFMHTQAAVTVAANGLSADLTQGGQTVRATILSPAGAAFTVMNPVPLPTSPNPAGQNVNTGWRKLAIHLTGVTNLTLTVYLVPVTASMPAAPALQVLGPNWPTGVTGILTGKKSREKSGIRYRNPVFQKRNLAGRRMEIKP